MIRLKCPKCNNPLAVDDEEAGGVGECEECGAKFRIPAAKSKPVRARAGKGDDEEEEEEEEEERPRRRRRPVRDEKDDDDEQGARKPRKSRETTGLSVSFLMNLKALAILAVLFIMLTFGSLFVKGMGPMVFVGSLFLAIMAILALFFNAKSNGGPGAFLCMVFGIFALLSALSAIANIFMEVLPKDSPISKWPYFLCLFAGTFFWSGFMVLYVLQNWKDTGKFAIIWVACLILCILSYVMTIFNLASLEARREIRMKEVGFSAVYRTLDVAHAAGHDPLGRGGAHPS